MPGGTAVATGHERPATDGEALQCSFAKMVIRACCGIFDEQCSLYGHFGHSRSTRFYWTQTTTDILKSRLGAQYSPAFRAQDENSYPNALTRVPIPCVWRS